MTLETMADAEILAIANPIMDNLMDASTAIDHERHIRDFTERAKGMLSKDWFEKICEEYQSTKGLFTGREFVAIFRRPESFVVVWRQGFSKQPGEFLAELLIVLKDGRYLVEHVMVL